MLSQLSPFFNPLHFAEACTLDGQPVQGIFDDAYAVGEVGLGMATSQPTLLLPATDVPADPVGLPCEVRGVAYTVEDTQPDGTGCTLLLLEVA